MQSTIRIGAVLSAGGVRGVCASKANGWPILEIIDSLLFRSRPWYLSDHPLTFRHCPCGCNALIIVLEPALPDLPWPQTVRGPEVQAAAEKQVMALIKPYLEIIQKAPTELLEKVLPKVAPTVSGGCRC